MPEYTDVIDHHDTYNEKADGYEALVSHEDYQQHILPAIQKIQPLQGKDILDLGAGTGRLTLLSAPYARSVTALDLYAAMLSVTSHKLKAAGHHNGFAAAADHRALPLRSACADVILSGWSICYLADWYPKTWKTEVDKALAEMKRVLRPGGMAIILETQGTGFETPHPPPHIQHYLDYLPAKGFTFEWIRTDYRFESLTQAVNLARFFFGDELAQKVEEKHWQILPECTGIWWKRM